MLSAQQFSDLLAAPRTGEVAIYNVDGALVEVDAAGNVSPTPEGSVYISNADGVIRERWLQRYSAAEARRAREDLADRIVADVAGGLAVLCHDRVGAPAVPGLTDEMCWERARNIVGALLGNYEIKEKKT